MARMHSRKRGKSGSTKPVNMKEPAWARYKAKEIEKLVIKLAKEDEMPSEIGIHLRDTYGVPNIKVACGKSITTILAEKKLEKEFPQDMLNLMNKSLTIRKHLEENHKDQTAKRGMILTDSKIRRLVSYYKRTGKVAADWNYDPGQLKLYVQ